MYPSPQCWHQRHRLRRRSLKIALRCYALTALVLLPLLGAADTESTPPTRPGPPNGWTTELGAAVLLNPRFQGSNRYRTLAVPYIDARFRDDQGTLLFVNVPQGIGGYLLRRGPTDNRFGVSLALAPGFASRDPEDIVGIDTFGAAAEARLRLVYQKGAFSIETTLAQALGSGHEGGYLDLAVNWQGQLGRRGFFSVGPSLRYGNNHYIGALYGITRAESTASGLTAFDAKQGFESFGLGGVVSVPMSSDWRLTSVVRYSQLLDDARDSSLTEDSNQAFVLVALTRRF